MLPLSASQIYHEAIKALAAAAIGEGALAAPDGRALVDNPLCGDRVEMEVKVADGRVAAVAHQVRGCLLCRAVASVIGKHAAGASPAEIERVSAGVSEMLEKQAPPPAALEGPGRVRAGARSPQPLPLRAASVRGAARGAARGGLLNLRHMIRSGSNHDKQHARLRARRAVSHAAAAIAALARQRSPGKSIGFIDNSKPNFNHLVDDLSRRPGRGARREERRQAPQAQRVPGRCPKR